MVKAAGAESAEVPLHRRIRGDIETRIMSGLLMPGDKVPFEHELMRAYGCSRMTVNKALSALAATGLIDRQRGAGSVVAQPRIHMAALAIPDIREEIVKRGFAYRLELLSSERVAGSAIPEGAMRTGRAGEILSLRCLHIADTRVFAVEERLINLDAVPDAADADFSQTPPGGWLLAHVPWTEAEHKIMAAQAGDLAAVLGVAAETACLILERKTWRAGASITSVRHTFPGDCFDLSAHFLAQAAATA